MLGEYGGEQRGPVGRRALGGEPRSHRACSMRFQPGRAPQPDVLPTMAPPWCAAPRDTGTYVSRVVMPRAT